MTSIAIATPARPSARSGNHVTATRWATLLRQFGHEVAVVPFAEQADPATSVATTLGGAGVLIALHARRAATIVDWWTEHRAGQPVIVALTGTDLYRDLPGDRQAAATIERADAVIVLQRSAVDRLERMRQEWAAKSVVVHQSVDPTSIRPRQLIDGEFRVVVLAHLREVKDPLLAARAARLLPASSSVMVHHAGGALDDEWQQLAEEEHATNPRYHWHREVDGPAAMSLLASADLLACTSRAEGGANVVTEAIATGVPVVGTSIDGNTGLLGADYPGLVPVGDHAALAHRLDQLERNPPALADLDQRVAALRSITEPAAEQAALAAVLAVAQRRNS
ncbi:MAG: selenoneine biosynthesis selenosugar synthase SenB [Actinomycetota bacterium]